MAISTNGCCWFPAGRNRGETALRECQEKKSKNDKTMQRDLDRPHQIVTRNVVPLVVAVVLVVVVVVAVVLLLLLLFLLLLLLAVGGGGGAVWLIPVVFDSCFGMFLLMLINRCC